MKDGGKNEMKRMMGWTMLLMWIPMIFMMKDDHANHPPPSTEKKSG